MHLHAIYMHYIRTLPQVLFESATFDSCVLEIVNYHGFTPVASLKAKLRLPAVFFTLHANIVANRGFVNADCGYKIANRPNTWHSPIYLVQMGKLRPQLSPGVGFDHIHHLTYWILRRNRYEHMYMINVRVYFQYLNLRMNTAYLKHYLTEILSNTGLQYLPAVFGRYDYMVTRVVYGMRLLTILHPRILTEDSGHFHLRAYARRITSEH